MSDLSPDPLPDLSWSRVITGQMDFWWDVMFRPRMAGLTTREYRWEPAPGEPPVTTIAWRMHHVASGLARRSGDQFGRTPVAEDAVPQAASAEEALEQLDEEYAVWRGGVEALGEAGLARPCGPTEGPFAAAPLADLVLHVYRELLCHGAEMCLVRDLFAARSPRHDEAP